MVARTDFINDKKAKLDWYTPRPMPKGDYVVIYNSIETTIKNKEGKYRYICVPGFFSLIKENGDPTLVISGDYVLDDHIPEKEE